MPEPVRLERRPHPGGTLPLVAAYLSGEERLAPLYAHFPPATVPRPGVPSVDRPIDEATAAAIGRWNEERGATGRSLENAGRGGGGRTRFVLAGQQPGLLLGPELTLWKMLTQTALADLLAERLGAPVVPLFWIAAHDADLHEVDRVILPGPEGERRAFRYPFPKAPERTQVGAFTVVEEKWLPFLEELRRTLPPTADRDALLEAAARTVPGPTPVADLFARWTHHLLPGSGLVLFDGREAERARAGRSILAAAVRDGAGTIEALRAGAALVERAGLEPSLPFDPERLPLFLLDGPVRRPLRLVEGRIRLEEGGSFDPAVLARRIEEGEARATPAAALRPVVQDGIFPSVATVVGHGELAYHAQLGPLYAKLGVRRPPLVPRASFALLPARLVEKVRALGLDLAAIAAGREPAPAIGEGEAVGKDLVRRVRALTDRALADFDRALPGALPPDDPARTRLVKEAERTAARLARHADRKGANRRNLAHRVRNLLRPGGKEQELSLSPLDALARYGPAVVGAIAGAVTPGDALPALLVVKRGGP